MSDNIWIIRAGRSAIHIDDFVEDGFVAVGWDIGKLDSQPKKQDVEQKLRDAYPNKTEGTIGVWASQIVRFCNEISIGDTVATYNPNNRLYYLGEVTSKVAYTTPPHSYQRQVRWHSQIPRDVLSLPTRNSLGAILTLFLIRDRAAAEMLSHRHNIGTTPATDSNPDPPMMPQASTDTRELLEEAVTRSAEIIEDLIAALSWEQVQDLVAEILKAMGYRTRVSPKGPDRGVDVFASPDGLGLQEPRIFVEVKHRPNTQIGSPDIRSFLGGRQIGDKCLFVSTGGFSREARYEAERSNIPITLLTLPRLRELIVEYYDRMSPAGTTLIPLERIYWPAWSLKETPDDTARCCNFICPPYTHRPVLRWLGGYRSAGARRNRDSIGGRTSQY